MPCPKCHGCLRDTEEELYCLNCGLRPVVSIPSATPGPRPLATDTILANRRFPIRERLKRAGLCVLCGIKRRTPAEPDKTLCARHAEMNRRAVASWSRNKRRGAA